MSDPIPIKIEVDDAELDAAIAKLDTVIEKQGSSVVSAAPAAEASASSNVAAYDEDAAYAAMREQQRNAMFGAGGEEQSGEFNIQSGRATSAILGILQGRLPTNFLLRQGLRSVGIAGPAGILAMFGIDLIIQTYMEDQAQKKFDENMRKFEIQRKVQFASIYGGVTTE